MSSYLPPSQYDTVTAQGSDPTSKRRDPRYIRLQQVEHQISEFSLLKVYITIILMIVIVKFFLDIFAPNPNSFSKYFDLGVRVVQILCYGYGLQAHVSKSFFQGRVFLIYLILSFGLIAYQTYTAIATKSDWYYVGFDGFNFLFNIFLVIITARFVNLLRERDNLRKSMEEKNVEAL